MVKGIGTDIIEISRIKKAAQRERFLNRVFTLGEIKEFKRRRENHSFLAGCFAAKEAFSKALGTGISGFSFSDIEIKKDSFGKPYINPLKDFGVLKENIYLSVSHSKDNAIAFCLITD